MNARQSFEDLFSYLHVDERDPWESGATLPGRTPSALKAMNAALQEVATKSGSWVKRQSRGVTLNAPFLFQGNVSLTEGSKQIQLTAAMGWQDWMLGCTIKIPGMRELNEIVDYDSGTEIGTLLFPYRGATVNNETVTVYHDCIKPDADVKRIYTPVELADSRKLAGVDSIGKLRDIAARTYGWEWGDYDFHFQSRTSMIARHPGEPLAYFVDTHYQPGETNFGMRLRIAPMPAEPYSLLYRAEILPPKIEQTDIWVGSNTPPDDPDVAIPVPYGMVESIYQPIALKKFASSPFFRNREALASINEEYKEARMLLHDLKPQSKSGFITVPGPG